MKVCYLGRATKRRTRARLAETKEEEGAQCRNKKGGTLRSLPSSLDRDLLIGYSRIQAFYIVAR